MSDRLPKADQVVPLQRVTPTLSEMLKYVGETVLEGGGDLGYISKDDLLYYHMRVKNFDQTMFEHLTGVDDVWVLVKGGCES